jgi:serine/threonine-protein kinase
LVELLGRGGMGEVWRARDTVTDRVVAIKVLPASLSEDAEFQRRFRREAHAAARLDTPHAVPIYDYGEIDGRLFVSMRLITGRDLATVLGDGPLEPARAVRIIDQVAKALHAAHKIGLIHRDIKPSNILLDDDDFAYLIDFGIARAADETRMTKSGNIIGSFAYIAPERLDPQTEEDARTDIYSLACVLYESLTGQPPFPGSTTVHLMYAHAHTPPPRPSASQPDVPSQVDDVIATGMAKDPNQRYATTIELANAARDAITDPLPRPTPSPPTLPATEQEPIPLTERAGNRVSAQATTLKAESLASAKQARPRPTQPIPTSGGGISRRTTIAFIVGVFALVAVIAAAVGISALVKHRPSESSPTTSEGGAGDTVRVASSKLVTEPGTRNPKAVVSFYEDFLCPACGNFQRTFGPTVSKLIDIGAIAADYSMVSILDSPRNQNYSSRAGAAALCVADESIDAFRRFHAGLYSTSIQPNERGTSFPDNARLIELAREAGAAGTVPDCINGGKYLSKVTGEAVAANINATPTIKINGDNYDPSTPDALVATIKNLVGNVPGIDSAATPPTP